MTRSDTPGYAARLRDWVRNARESGVPADPDTLNQIETWVEELHAAEEELRVKSADLEEALDEANRQRRRYEELFLNAPAPYLTTDSSGTIREINHAAGALIGLQPELATGNPLPLFVPERQELRSRLERLGRLERVDSWETDVVPRRGENVPVRMSAVPMAGGEGEETEIRWVLTDLRPEREVRARERDLHREQATRAALQRVAGRARFLSEASARLMGRLDPEEVWDTAAAVLRTFVEAGVLLELGEDEAVHVTAVIGESDHGRRLQGLRDRRLELGGEKGAEELPLARIALALRQGEPEVVTGPEGPAHGPPGAAAPGPCLIVPLQGRHGPRGAAVVWLGHGATVGEELLVMRTLADRVTLALETAELFQELVRARRTAEEASAAESDFLAVVSHELRTPLTAIVSYAELLKGRADELPEKLARYANQIAGAAEHQRRLVDQILAYKRLQRGSDPLACEELDFRQPVELAASMARPLAKDRPVEVQLDLPDEPVVGRCDPGRLRQILTNLLTNAIRHTREGYVRLSLQAEDPWMVFRVEDTGEGIPEEALPRIFDRFWRGPSTGVTRGGSGLGLTITRELVTGMGGEITVESEPDVGTIVTVRLPRRQPVEEAV